MPYFYFIMWYKKMIVVVSVGVFMFLAGAGVMYISEPSCLKKPILEL